MDLIGALEVEEVCDATGVGEEEARALLRYSQANTDSGMIPPTFEKLHTMHATSHGKCWRGQNVVLRRSAAAPPLCVGGKIRAARSD